MEVEVQREGMNWAMATDSTPGNVRALVSKSR